MIKLTKIQKGDRLNSATKINSIIEAVEELQNAQPGPGLAKTRDGVLYLAAKSSGTAVGSKSPSSGGTELELDQTQGTQDTDTWTRSSDDCPVVVQVVTDIKYDTSTHKLTFRTRDFTFDRGGNLTAISAESALVEVTTAVPES